MTLAAAPDSLQGAVAAGILGCGPVILGTAEACAKVLSAARERVEAGEEAGAVAQALAGETHACGGRMPGFGHPVHRPLDPRAERILELADERGVGGIHVALARHFRAAVAEVWGKPLPMNVSMPIAAVLLDLDFPADMIKAIPILARTGGLLAHLAEERRRPIGFLMAAEGEAAIAYDGGPEAET
jgi:citrate synthase